MSFDELSKIVPDETILALWKPLYEPNGATKDLTQSDLVAPLFSSKDTIANISHAIEALCKSLEAKIHPETCVTMLTKIQSYALSNGADHGISQGKIDEFVALCTTYVKKGTTTPVSSDLYSRLTLDTNWRLADFETLLPYLAADDYALSRQLQKGISDQVREDPEVKSMSLSERFLETPDAPFLENGEAPWNATYDQNRLGSHDCVGEKAVTLNWCELHMPHHRYFAGGAPCTLEGVSVLFNHLIAEKCPVIVSLHQLGKETAGRMGEFWKPETLQHVPLQDGWAWSLNECTSQVIQDDSIPAGASLIPLAPQSASGIAKHPQETAFPLQIVKSLVVALRGEERAEIVHFHSVGWPEFRPHPSLAHFQLLMNLLMHIEVPPGAPFAANCKAGCGRTALVIVMRELLLELIEQLKKGVDPDEVRLNIMERFGQGRKQRRIFIDGSTKFVEVLRSLFEVYKIIKRVGVQRFLQEQDIRLFDKS